MRRALFVVAALILSSVAASPARAQVEGWKKGKLLASEDFSQGLQGWLAEGDVRAAVQDGSLRFEATELSDVKKGNIWWKKLFRGPMRVEFDYRSATKGGLTMFWFMAQGRDGEDLLTQKRTGVYEQYVIGKMNGYHVSFHRFGSGVSNLRKSYGFHILSTAPDPIPADDLGNHHVAVSVLGNRIVVAVDGKVIHDYTDRGQPCISPEKDWVHVYPCKGTGPALSEGYIGIRHTQRQVAYYDNFRVWRMEKL